MTRPAELLDRLPPQDLDAERSVIGCCLLDSAVLDDLSLKPGDFYAEANAILFRHLRALRERGRVDVLLLRDSLTKAAELEAIGGEAYLATCATAVPYAANVQSYAKIVRAKAEYRAIIHASTEALRDGYEATEEVPAILGRLEGSLANIGRDADGGPVHISVAVQEALDRIDAVATRQEHLGLPTGFWQFDSDIGGLFAGELSILAADASIGKSALAMQIAYHNAARGKLVYVASLEMAPVELMTRLLCGEADVSSRLVRTARLSKDDMAAIASAGSEAAQASMVLHCRGGLTAGDIGREARRLARNGLSLVVVDYLQLLTPEDTRVNREQQISRMAWSLKSLAVTLHVPVLCLSQINRDAELSKGKEPELRHLRESGAIGQHADLVTFLMRPTDGKLPSEIQALATIPEQQERALWKIDKNRNGPLGRYPLQFSRERTMFRRIQPANYESAFDD